MTPAEGTSLKVAIGDLKEDFGAQSNALFAVWGVLEKKAKAYHDDELCGLAEIVNLMSGRISDLCRKHIEELQFLLDQSPENIETLELLHVIQGDRA
ncbi:hypothetical protein OR1_03509 [Geobacter sp. OR-1]|uniref:hypothetical protein n=1 Tax=Geobacter sp. OR-1 TaxID=1266765 RepID=UPI000543C251|nr:hypothetical protein [Geobacter sp. OR-1]GAM11199.1 hypothetical protein OR1_03509 [Geobacter sp. OR-1]